MPKIETGYEFGTHITFAPAPPKPKTLVWCVMSKDDRQPIGVICWYAPWRKYSFLPNSGTVFEQVCLREIADFCERKTKEHKAKKTQKLLNSLAACTAMNLVDIGAIDTSSSPKPGSAQPPA